ncbi:MAG: hypothetical protein MJ087_06950 [Lachnospiraceae bacterium]|nr:hypothetical protein [Lachnospiraceae bacterium]
MAEINKMELEQIVLKNMYHDANGNRDICPIYHNKEELNKLLDYLAEPFYGKVDYVVSPESLGFILGGMLAEKLDVGFIPVRSGHHAVLADDEAIRAPYIDHRNNVRALQVRESNLPKKARVLLVDDWVNTVATLHACKIIVEEGDCEVVGIACFGVNYNNRTKRQLELGKIHTVLVIK